MRDITTALILAGGAGRRVGGRDKGTLQWEGLPLVAHVCRRLRPQVREIWISCNRNMSFYSTYADRVLQDELPGFAGPVAGIASASGLIKTPFLLVTACDTPQLPADLVARLQGPMQNPAIQVCIAHDGEREQYLASLLRSSSLRGAGDYLARGERSVRGWYSSLRRERVDFSDQAACFANFNRLDSEASGESGTQGQPPPDGGG